MPTSAVSGKIGVDYRNNMEKEHIQGGVDWTTSEEWELFKSGDLHLVSIDRYFAPGGLVDNYREAVCGVNDKGSAVKIVELLAGLYKTKIDRLAGGNPVIAYYYARGNDRLIGAYNRDLAKGVVDLARLAGIGVEVSVDDGLVDSELGRGAETYHLDELRKFIYKDKVAILSKRLGKMVGDEGIRRIEREGQPLSLVDKASKVFGEGVRRVLQRPVSSVKPDFRLLISSQMEGEINKKYEIALQSVDQGA